MGRVRIAAWSTRRAITASAVLAAALWGHAGAQTADQLRREIDALGVRERLGAFVPPEAGFTDEDGRPLTFGMLRGRPVLLSFNYTGCPRLCGPQLAGLARALRDLGWTGDRFSIATVSIDPEERRPQLARHKETFVRQAGGGAALARAWHFVAGARREIDALAESVGFRYRYDARTGEFAHQATLVVLSPDGRVSGYLHGISYEPAALRVALDRAVAGEVATQAQQASLGGFLLTCMGFDPADPAPRALKIMRAGGTAVLLFLFAFVAVHLARDGRRGSGHRP